MVQKCIKLLLTELHLKTPKKTRNWEGTSGLGGRRTKQPKTSFCSQKKSIDENQKTKSKLWKAKHMTKLPMILPWSWSSRFEKTDLNVSAVSNLAKTPLQDRKNRFNQFVRALNRGVIKLVPWEKESSARQTSLFPRNDLYKVEKNQTSR